MQEQTVSADTLEPKTNHLRERSTWVRILYMIGFTLAYGVTEFILTSVVIIQLILRLFTGKLNERLRAFSSDLTQYVYDILRFLTFNTESMPFPLSEWKHGDKAD